MAEQLCDLAVAREKLLREPAERHDSAVRILSLYERRSHPAAADELGEFPDLIAFLKHAVNVYLYLFAADGEYALALVAAAREPEGQRIRKVAAAFGRFDKYKLHFFQPPLLLFFFVEFTLVT